MIKKYYFEDFIKYALNKGISLEVILDFKDYFENLNNHKQNLEVLKEFEE